MKIAYLTADFGVPVFGTKGASVHVRRLVQALCELGHDVLVLTPNLGEDRAARSDFRVAAIPLDGALDLLYEELKREPICRGNRLAKDIRNLLYAAELAVHASAMLAEFRPDFIYERYSLFGTAGLALAQRCGVPLVLEVNAPLVHEQERERGLSLPVVARAAERLVFTGADHVVVVSQWLKDYVTAQGVSRDRVTVVPNAADPELFCPRPRASELRHSIGWDDEFVIGFVGSMKRWHGVPTVLESLKACLAADDRYRLLLVGDGPERQEIEQQARAMGLTERVRLTGGVPHEAVPDWIAAMDVAVAPYAGSADEYFSPVKLFEYMAMARPVVAAAIGQIGEIIEDGRTGYVYPAGDSEALAGRLRWLAENRVAGEQVGAAARQAVLARYTWRHNAERVVSIADRIRRRSAAVSDR